MIETSDVVRVIRDNNLAPSNSQLDPNTTLEELGIDCDGLAGEFRHARQASVVNLDDNSGAVGGDGFAVRGGRRLVKPALGLADQQEFFPCLA